MSKISTTFIVKSDILNDNRILNEAKSLSQVGISVNLIAVNEISLPDDYCNSFKHVKRFSLFFRAIGFPKYLQALEFNVRALFNFLINKTSYVHCHDLTALPSGFWIKRLLPNTILVYDAHEYETELNGLSGLRKKIYKWLERKLIVRVDRFITVSESIAKAYIQLYQISNPVIIHNCPYRYHTQHKHDLLREEFSIPKQSKIFLYQGILAEGRGVREMLEVFSGFTGSDYVLVLMGFGPMTSFVQSFSKEHRNVFYKQAMPAPHFLNYTSSADFGISFIEDISLSDRFCLPNKLFEYINAGIPVIVSDLPEMKKFVTAYKVGAVAATGSSRDLINAIHDIAHMSYPALLENVRSVANLFCWEEESKKLLHIYNT